MLAIVLAFIAAVAVATMLDVGDRGVCGDSALSDCYDFSSSAKPLVLAFGWAGAVVIAFSAPVALAFAIRGRGGRDLLGLAGFGAVLLAISILIARIS